PSPLALDVLQTIDAKEARATPGRAGDGARDGGEASVGGLSPHVAAQDHSDRVPLALVFAHEHGAGLGAPGAVRSRLVAPCEAVEKLCGIRIKPTEGLLLNRATRSLVRAGGGDDRNVVRHRVRSSLRPSDRTRSISASIASRSDDRRAMPVTPPCDPTFPWFSPRLSRR